MSSKDSTNFAPSLINAWHPLNAARRQNGTANTIRPCSKACDAVIKLPRLQASLHDQSPRNPGHDRCIGKLGRQGGTTSGTQSQHTHQTPRCDETSPCSRVDNPANPQPTTAIVMPRLVGEPLVAAVSIPRCQARYDNCITQPRGTKDQPSANRTSMSRREPTTANEQRLSRNDFTSPRAYRQIGGSLISRNKGG